jgi:hypothetical protein
MSSISQWHKLSGSVFNGGSDVVNITQPKENELELLVSTKPIVSRGDALNGK